MNRLETLKEQNQQAPGFNWVMELVKSYDFEKVGNLKGKTIVITGGSRGIGLAIAKIAAKDGANIAILAKTVEEHSKLPGTIHSAAKEIEEAGGRALPLKCDIRDEKNLQECVDKVVSTFGGIDILINNASAISLTDTADTSMKKFDLMHQVNTRGTFMASKICIPHLRKAQNPHILNISPPLNMDPDWFAPHVAYTMAKYGMSMCVLGMSQEFKSEGIAVNALWPKTAIATSAVKFALGGDESMRKSRTDQIMADSAYIILNSNSKKHTGQFFIDDEVLVNSGVSNFDKYKVDPSVHDSQLLPDLFL